MTNKTQLYLAAVVNSIKMSQVCKEEFDRRAEQLRKMEKDGEITEDELKSNEDSVQKFTDKFIKNIDEALDKKEKELTTV